MRVVIDGCRVHVRDHGRGDPIVLLHPGPGLDGGAFYPWFERLHDRFRVVAVDLPGNGRSGAGDPARWNARDWAADVRAVADALALERYTLLGHSYGARVALQHAVDHPGHAARLVLSGGVAHGGALADLEDRLMAFEPAELRERVLAGFELEEVAETPEACRHAWSEQLPFMLAEREGPALAAIREAWREIVYRPEISRHGSFGTFDVRAALGQIAVPTLVVSGADDQVTTAAAGGEIAEGIPGARFEAVAGAGHFAFAEQPERYFALLEAWLSETAPPSVSEIHARASDTTAGSIAWGSGDSR